MAIHDRASKRGGSRNMISWRNGIGVWAILAVVASGSACADPLPGSTQSDDDPFNLQFDALGNGWEQLTGPTGLPTTKLTPSPGFLYSDSNTGPTEHMSYSLPLYAGGGYLGVLAPGTSAEGDWINVSRVSGSPIYYIPANDVSPGMFSAGLGFLDDSNFGHLNAFYVQVYLNSGHGSSWAPANFANGSSGIFAILGNTGGGFDYDPIDATYTAHHKADNAYSYELAVPSSESAVPEPKGIAAMAGLASIGGVGLLWRFRKRQIFPQNI